MDSTMLQKCALLQRCAWLGLVSYFHYLLRDPSPKSMLAGQEECPNFRLKQEAVAGSPLKRASPELRVPCSRSLGRFVPTRLKPISAAPMIPTAVEFDLYYY